MAINLAEKHSSAVDEVLRKGALTTPLENSDQVDFIGAQTVKVHSMDTAEMNDYKASGDNRYGTPEELGDSVQEMTLSRKRSFTYTIDATNRLDSPEGIRDAARSLRRQLDERVIPELDGYRLATAAKNAQFVDYYTPDKSTILSQIAAMNAELSNAEVPSVNRLFFTDPRVVSKRLFISRIKHPRLSWVVLQPRQQLRRQPVKALGDTALAAGAFALRAALVVGDNSKLNLHRNKPLRHAVPPYVVADSVPGVRQQNGDKPVLRVVGNSG